LEFPLNRYKLEDVLGSQEYKQEMERVRNCKSPVGGIGYMRYKMNLFSRSFRFKYDSGAVADELARYLNGLKGVSGSG